jgi:hypothetical protein
MNVLADNSSDQTNRVLFALIVTMCRRLHVAGAEALSSYYCQFDVTTLLHKASLANAMG